MEDLFQADQPLTEANLRDELTQKWKEKFPTADEELIRSKVDSDLYIKTLERQKDELRNDWLQAQKEIQDRANLSDLIDRLNNQGTPPADTQKSVNTPVTPDLAEIEKLIEQKYEQKRRSEIEMSNFNKVQSKLLERFGQNSATVLQEQANNLGLSKEDVNNIAKKSPDAFFKLMGLETQQSTDVFAPPRSNVRNDHFAPKQVVRDWNYYQDMKAKNPKQYWDPKTQLQMHRDADALGARFGIEE